MSATLNPSPFVLATLQNLSTMTAARGVGHIFSRPAHGHSEARAFGGLDLAMGRSGKDAPAKVRYGAIRVTPRATGSAFSKSPGVHHAIDRGYDNPGVRFGDHIRSGRPVSSAGETSCHFSQTSVSKTSPIREMIKAARGGRRRTGSKAAAHVLYVEREGAAEKIDKYELLYGARFTDEMERRAADRSAVAQQAYIERAGAAEGLERVPGRPITDDDLDALDEGSFGTIGATVAERTRFWEAVEAAEATPKGDRIVVKPADNPTWWARAVKKVEGAPAAARTTILAENARGDGEPFEIKLPTDKAFAFHQWAVGIDTEAPLEISPGRGGRTQTRIIAELPHELDGRERLQVVRDFTHHLSEKGFPFWAVIHAPDDNNDARNYHVHIAYYDRPAAQMKRPDGKVVWDFEIQEEIVYKSKNGGAKRYMARPHQQNRDRTTHDREWITILRKHWETSTNRVLEDAGQTKRYNLGTYASMGIALEPQKHINPRTFNKERKGELTEDGPVLARRQWDAAQDAALKDHQSQAERRFARINALAETATAGMARHPQRGLAVDLVERLRVLGTEISAEKARADLMLNLGRIVMDRVMSRPKLIMFDAMKEDDKARKKAGRGPEEPVADRALPSAEMFGPRTRNELSALIVAISDVALKLDKEHERFVQVANSRLRYVLNELKVWAANPMQPVTGAHLVRLRGERAADPAEVERQRRNRIVAFQADFIKRLEKTLPEFLEKVAQRNAAAEQAAKAATEKPSPALGQSMTAGPAKPADAPRPVAQAQTSAGASEGSRRLSLPQPSVPTTTVTKLAERKPFQHPAYMTPEAILDDRPSGRGSGRPSPSARMSNGAPRQIPTVEAAQPERNSAPITEHRRSATSTVATGQTSTAIPGRTENAKPAPAAGVRPSAQDHLLRAAPPSEGRPRKTADSTARTQTPAPIGTEQTRVVTPVTKSPAPEATAPETSTRKGNAPRPPLMAKPDVCMVRPEDAEAGGPAKIGVPALKAEAPTRATPIVEASRTSPSTKRGAPTCPVSARPEGIRPVSACRASAEQTADDRVREPLLNLAAILEELENQRERVMAQNRKAAEAEHAETNMSETLQAGPPEIVGAERPPKKIRPPRQRQRTRDYNYDR